MKQGSVDECMATCDQFSRCKSFIYNKDKKVCFMKDKVLNGSEPMGAWNLTFTVYKSCIKGINK